MLTLLVALAFADIPPGPGFVETCTLANHQGEEKECTECSGSFSGREDCEALEKDGYSTACRTAGASVWDEVMCRSKTGKEPEGEVPAPAPAEETPEPSVPQDAKRRRCDTAGGVGSVWALPLVMVLGRRRR